MIDDVVASLPPHLRAPVDGLLQRPVRSREQMLAELERYTQRVDGAAQVACDYHVDAQDEDGDLESVFGIDDDAEVLDLVLDALERPDLKVRV